MSGLAVSVRDLQVRYRRTVAVDRATFDLDAGGIYGLLGRNGSGKTTLMSVIASYRRPHRGTVRLGGVEPFENERLMSQVCLVREAGDVQTEIRVRDNLSYLASARATWDPDYAEELVDLFGLNRKKTVSSLSRGQRSAFGAVIGLASRAPLTMFDEVHLGMDAPTRYAFYDALLADYVEHPRTIVLSSHLISEIEKLLSGVVVLQEGRVLVVEEADQFRSRGATLTGDPVAVDAIATGLTVLEARELGRTKQVTIYGDLDDAALAEAAARDLQIGAVPIQDLFVHLTAKESK